MIAGIVGVVGVAWVFGIVGRMKKDAPREHPLAPNPVIFSPQGGGSALRHSPF